MFLGQYHLLPTLDWSALCIDKIQKEIKRKLKINMIVLQATEKCYKDFKIQKICAGS